ncbi:VanW family protein [Bacillus sp. FJAT-45037]|uniref:VanW family protein n=1 Tax=Bacillus sp. FJAT-45037 TaxID=2011007 RepID=UPI000C2331A2|nr:VanW family protein [Bacillus sp. FJAT-45037]
MPSNEHLSITFEQDTLVSIHREEFFDPYLGRSIIDQDKYEELVESVEKQVYVEPVNATLDPHGQLVSEEIGYKLNRRAFDEAFYSYFFGTGHASFEVPRYKLYPKVDQTLLQSLRTEAIGAYATYYNTYNHERAHNIALATEAINNHVVFPGETFSFNTVVGKRTVERGYLLAPVIVRGELTEGIGGGICQVSSTLFNAADRAGMDIIERYTHSKRVTYVPPGRDATVSWYGPDFVFQNKQNQPILIIAKTYNGTLLVKLSSSEKIDYEPRNVPKAPNKLPPEVDAQL